VFSKNKISVGFAGLAKNVGKTTALISVLDNLRSLGKRIALTSIGYDGEEIDNITGLPKPKYFLKVGDLVATAQRCLVSGLRVVQETDVFTPLGRVLIARLERDTRVILAGPNKLRDLEKALTMFFSEGAEVALVDGSINRVYPLKLVDRFILSTGIARTGNLNRLKLEVEALNFFASLPVAEPSGNALEFIPSNIAPYKGQDLIFKEGVNFLLSEDLIGTYLKLKRHLLNGGKLGVINPLKISAITVSTFYPKPAKEGFEPAFMDIDLERELSFSKIPVIDVKRGRDGRRLAKIVLGSGG